MLEFGRKQFLVSQLPVFLILKFVLVINTTIIGYKNVVCSTVRKQSGSLAYIKLEYFLISVRLLKKVLYWFWKHNAKNWPATAYICTLTDTRPLARDKSTYQGKWEREHTGYLLLIYGTCSWQPTPHSQVLLHKHMHWPYPNEWSDISSSGLLQWHQPQLGCKLDMKVWLAFRRKAPVHTPQKAFQIT